MMKEMQDGQISKEIPSMFQKLILILNNSFDQITRRNQNNINNIKLENNSEIIETKNENENETQNNVPKSNEISKISESSTPSKNLLLNDVENNIEIINSDVDENSDSMRKVGDNSILVIPPVLLSLSQPPSLSLSTSTSPSPAVPLLAVSSAIVPALSSTSSSTSSSSSSESGPNAFCAMRAGLETVSDATID